MNTATVSVAVTPTVVSTLLSHYANRKPRHAKPTAHLSYDQGLALIRSFLAFASQHTVEDLQAFTAQWVPHPQWVRVEEVQIPEEKTDAAAELLQEQLGPEGIEKVGGKDWWQWRKPDSPMKAEWIEMRSDYQERKRIGDPGRRVMLYVHGGAYFFGSVDEHRYQMQRHARKLKARVFAPRYRLAPQFPFPCGLHDCLAAYLYLLTVQDPSTIILAGDSAGGGMVLSMMVLLRDIGIPLPAGAILISPWVDLTHSFPSVAGDCPFDYIPQDGFHHKPSRAWPPLNAEEYAVLRDQIAKQTKIGHTTLMKPASIELKRRSQATPQADRPVTQETTESAKGSIGPEKYNAPTYLSIKIDGKEIQLKDQIQMYTTNELLSHPLVSPILQPTLGGLPPLLIMVGGGEILRDEQIYLAHKCANPRLYVPGDAFMDESGRENLERYKPTDVQLQIWDDLCHVAPTLSFTRPAKYMYRSVAQFGAWALARAQHTEIDILDDDDISVISESDSDSSTSEREKARTPGKPDTGHTAAVGKAGDDLPPFRGHMIRQRVDRHGLIRPLEAASQLPGCNMDPNDIGVIKEGPVRKWLLKRNQWDARFGAQRSKIHKRRLKDMVAGYEGFDGETPPPSALAGRRKLGADLVEKRKRKSAGLALWSLWGSKHDEATVQREQEADQTPDVKTTTAEEGAGARSQTSLENQEDARRKELGHSRSPSKRRLIKDDLQTASLGGAGEDLENVTPLAVLMARRTGQQPSSNSDPEVRRKLLTPDYAPPDTGATGKRPIIDGIAMPFTLDKEAETASMITLTSNPEGRLSTAGSSRPMSPENAVGTSHYTNDGIADEAQASGHATARPQSPPVAVVNDMEPDEPVTAGTPRAITPVDGTRAAGNASAMPAPLVRDGQQSERPPMETYVTASEELPRAK